MPANTFCHIEFDSTDLERSRQFYEGLFGWNFRSFGPEMMVFGQGDQHLGGLNKVEQVSAGASPSVWIEVPKLDAMIEKAVKSGGSLAKAREDIPNGIGWSAVVLDPDGNRVGMVEFKPQPA